MNSSHAKNLNLGTIIVGEIRQVSKYTDYGYQWFSKIVKNEIQVFKSAEVSASVFKKAIRLTPEQLAADPAFITLARQAIRAGKKYTAELCLWEHKQTVIAAVDIIRRTIVEQEEAEQQRHRDAQQAAIDAKREAERPTRDAVELAYDACGYRQCRQGHTMQVAIGDKPGVECDVVRGERYSSRCRYSRMESFHEITVTRDWINTVHAFDLDTWCGRVVIDMKFLGVADDCQVLLEITTVKQGLGTALETENVTVFGANRQFAKVGKRLPMVHPMPAGVAADFMQDKGVPDKFTNALRLNPF